MGEPPPRPPRPATLAPSHREHRLHQSKRRALCWDGGEGHASREGRPPGERPGAFRCRLSPSESSVRAQRQSPQRPAHRFPWARSVCPVRPLPMPVLPQARVFCGACSPLGQPGRRLGTSVWGSLITFASLFSCNF